MICGKPLRYDRLEKRRTCAICGRQFLSHEECVDGHYVCDECHAAPSARILQTLESSSEKSPSALMESLWKLPEVHLFGPEHHWILPCVLLSCYRNCGGELELEPALDAAWKRGSQVAGGSCGYWGACGAAIGAGIYFSVLLGSTPVHPSAWSIPQKLTAQCLDRISDYTGPRCCKRTCRMAIETAVRSTWELCRVRMPVAWSPCAYAARNHECMRTGCPYYKKSVQLEL
jgi:hypothetical protein